MTFQCSCAYNLEIQQQRKIKKKNIGIQAAAIGEVQVQAKSQLSHLIPSLLLQGHG
jgi:hypothetical protein